MKSIAQVRPAIGVCIVLGILFGLGDLARVIARNVAYAWDPGTVILWALKSAGLAVIFSIVFTLPMAFLYLAIRPGERSPERVRRVVAGAWIALHVFLILLWRDYSSLEAEITLERMLLKGVFLLCAAAVAWLLSRPAGILVGFIAHAFRPRVIAVLGGLVLALFVVASQGEGRGPEARGESTAPNVLFILVDTLRADALGSYGYTRPTSPNIDRLASQSVLFVDAFAESSWTIPTVASIFSGVYPDVHGVTNYEAVLSDSFVTLAEAFQAAGYRTGARISNILIRKSHGYHQGFDDAQIVMNLYKKLFIEKLLAQARLTRHYDFAPGNEITDAAIDWLRKKGQEPFFFYVHYYDPHYPYYPPPGYAMRYVNPDMAKRYPYHSFVGDSIWNVVSEYKMDDSPSPGMVAYNRAVYDAEVSFVDDEIERLLSYVREAGLDENTIVVFTSDHGEQFYDHGGRLHSKTLYNEEIRVPLIIRAPGYEPRKAKDRIRALDIYRTLVDLAALPSRFAGAETAIEIERQTMGMSLVPLMRGEVDDASYSDEVFSSVDIDGVRKEAYLKGAWKLINNIERGDSLPRPPQELYRISQDPRELTDLSSEDDAQLRRLTMKEREGRKTMAGRAVAKAERKPLDEAEVEQLKALGYINR